MKHEITSIHDYEDIDEKIRNAYIAGNKITVLIEKPKRTDQQRKAIEVYCNMLAKKLSDSGKDIMTTLKQDASIPWTQELIKSLVWKPIQKTMFDTNSTTKLNTEQVSKVYEVINRHMGENHGVSFNFPNYDGRNYKE